MSNVFCCEGSNAEGFGEGAAAGVDADELPYRNNIAEHTYLFPMVPHGCEKTIIVTTPLGVKTVTIMVDGVRGEKCVYRLGEVPELLHDGQRPTSPSFESGPDTDRLGDVPLIRLLQPRPTMLAGELQCWPRTYTRTLAACLDRSSSSPLEEALAARFLTSAPGYHSPFRHAEHLASDVHRVAYDELVSAADLPAHKGVVRCTWFTSAAYEFSTHGPSPAAACILSPVVPQQEFSGKHHMVAYVVPRDVSGGWGHHFPRGNFRLTHCVRVVPCGMACMPDDPGCNIAWQRSRVLAHLAAMLPPHPGSFVVNPLGDCFGSGALPDRHNELVTGLWVYAVRPVPNARVAYAFTDCIPECHETSAVTMDLGAGWTRLPFVGRASPLVLAERYTQRHRWEHARYAVRITCDDVFAILSIGRRGEDYDHVAQRPMSVSPSSQHTFRSRGGASALRRRCTGNFDALGCWARRVTRYAELKPPSIHKEPACACCKPAGQRRQRRRWGCVRRVLVAFARNVIDYLYAPTGPLGRKCIGSAIKLAAAQTYHVCTPIAHTSPPLSRRCATVYAICVFMMMCLQECYDTSLALRCTQWRRGAVPSLSLLPRSIYLTCMSGAARL